MKPCMEQSFLTFDSMYITRKCGHSFESCLTVLWSCLFFNFLKFVILEHLSVLDLPLSGVKGLKEQTAYVSWFRFLILCCFSCLLNTSGHSFVRKWIMLSKPDGKSEQVGLKKYYKISGYFNKDIYVIYRPRGPDREKLCPGS